MPAHPPGFKSSQSICLIDLWSRSTNDCDDCGEPARPTELLSQAILINIIAPILVKIFNRFLELGEYPNCLKTAKVAALHKGSDRSNVDNYCCRALLVCIELVVSKTHK